MFKDIYPLAQQSAFSLLIAAAGTDLRIVLQPRPPKGDDLTKLAEQGLMEPLVLQGPPEELDEHFHMLVTNFTKERQSLVDQLETANNALKAAKEKSVKQANAAKDKKAGAKISSADKPSTPASISTSSPDSEDDESEAHESEASDENTAVTTTTATDLSLF